MAQANVRTPDRSVSPISGAQNHEGIWVLNWILVLLNGRGRGWRVGFGAGSEAGIAGNRRDSARGVANSGAWALAWHTSGIRVIRPAWLARRRSALRGVQVTCLALREMP